MDKKNNFQHIFRTLKYRNYRLFFSGQSISLIGTWIQMIAMGWLVYRLTNSAFMLGLVGFVGRLPTLFISPFAGVIADRWNKYKLLLLTQVLSMLQALAITILLFTDIVQIWHIIILSIALGLINSFDTPVRQSFVIEMIEKKEDLGNAIALNSAMVNGARLFGPTIAGILVGALGEGWCFLINTLSFIAIITTLLMMKIPEKKIEKKPDGHLAELKEGFKYAYNFIPIRYILFILSLVSLMGMPYQVLMPVFAKDIYHGGPNTLGFLMAAAGTGALIGALYLASRKSVVGLGKNIAIATAIFGSGLVIFSLSKTFTLSIIVLVITGFGMMVQMASSNTVLQTIVDDDKRGRIMSFYTMAFMGTVPFGNLLSGSLSGLIGVTNTVLAGGVCCILGAAFFAFKLPAIRKIIRPIYIEKQIIPVDIQ